ncbi:MAG: hypothetical protein RTU63_01385 [Candidatus Thorarchaeota archaeon]
MTELVTYKPMTQYYAVFAIGTILSLLIGFFIVPMFMPASTWDWIPILGLFVGLPVLLASLGYYYGWRFKVNVVEYNAPQWELEPDQLTIDEASTLQKQYNKENSRLVSHGNYWMFFIPIILLVFIPAIPVYSFIEDATFAQYASILLGGSFALLFAITIFTGYRTTSNQASSDFTLPLMRETIRLAKIQEKISGVSSIRVVLDTAESGNLRIYRLPRILLRIKHIEKVSYIESWTDDLGAITKVLCRLYEEGDNPQVVWWWVSEDRNFRKFVGEDQSGYYVKNLVQSNIRFPGVKDARLVTENSIALVIREYLKTREETEELRSILKDLNAEMH